VSSDPFLCSEQRIGTHTPAQTHQRRHPLTVRARSKLLTTESGSGTAVLSLAEEDENGTDYNARRKRLFAATEGTNAKVHPRQLEDCGRF
jgi:hypothetical protein